jgi:hypothetical protein
MTRLPIFRWFMAAGIAALWSAAVQPAAADRMGGSMGGVHGGMGGVHGGMGGGNRSVAPHFSGGRAPGHPFGHFDHRRDFAFRHHDFDHFRDRDDRFFHHHHNRFIFAFDFAAFGFPWWYPDYYYWDPYYSYYGYDPYYSYGPAYDSQYWTNLAVSVQSALAERGYYHGAIDGDIGSGSRQAIRAFQATQGLPVTGMIDPKLLKALGIKYKTA